MGAAMKAALARAFVLSALLLTLTGTAHADGRINIRIDFSKANVEGARNNVGIGWPGFEVEIEREFKTHKFGVSELSLGVRREAFYGFSAFGETQGVQRWGEGTYLSLRVHRSFALPANRSWSVSPSFALLYGIPGTTLHGTVITPGTGSGLDYTRVFPVRNADVPALLAKRADVAPNSAILYPEVSLSMKKRLVRGVNLEWVGGVRAIRFGIIDSNDQDYHFAERRTFVPSFGMRLGFRIF